MNHDQELMDVGVSLKILLAGYEIEIRKIEDSRHRPEIIQELDKAKHYMLKMSEHLDDLNRWFTAFGSPEEKQ